MTPDPLGGSVADPQSMNRYTYVLNDPETLVDPLGLCPSGMVDVPYAGGEIWVCQPARDLGGGGLVGGCTSFTAPSSGNCPVGNYGYGALIGKLPLTRPSSQELDTQQPCPTIPPHPANANVNANIQAGEQAMFPGTALDVASTNIWNMEWLYSQFKTGGPMDYKQYGAQYTDFGNFNYGAVCGAIGYSLSFCQSAAGAGLVGRFVHKSMEHRLGRGPSYQYGGAGIPFVKAPYGDQPADSGEIALGFSYQANCIQ